jgi:myo-inositol 2-dehydrogenase/D-chiro-inositol 1-dehydrogenase
VSPLRVGIIGCGRIVRLAHLASLQRHPDVRVVAIADPDPVSREFCSRHAPEARWFPTFDGLLAEVTIDAAVIAVPAPLHLREATRAFETGLHVYLEKPIATSVGDGEAIVAAWRRAGTVARIGFNCRFNRLYRELRLRIAGGTIGKPLAVRSSLTASWPEEATWRLAASSGGGALLELASHHVDLLRFLFDVEVVSSRAETWSNRGPDEAAMLQLRMANGVQAQTLVCHGTVEEDRVEVYGSEGKLVVDRYNSLAVEAVPVLATGGIGSALRRATRELSRIGYGFEKARATGNEPSFAASLAAFVTAAREGRDGAPSLEDGLASLRVIEAARAGAVEPARA